MTTRPSASPARSILHALAAAALLSAPAAFAQQPAPAPAPAAAPTASANLPAASEIIDKYIKAVGGRDAIQKKTARHTKSTLSITGDNAPPSEVETFAAAPDKFVYVAGGQFSGRRGYDGKVGWIINRHTGPSMLGGKRLEEIREQADFYSILHDPTKYLKMETVAIEEFEGAPCHKVRLLSKSGNETFEFFDVKTGLLAGSKIKRDLETEQPVDVTIVQADYKPFEGMLMPTKIIQRPDVAGMKAELILTISSYEFTPIDPAVFELPPEIKAMVVDQPKGLLRDKEKQQKDGAPK